VRGKRITIGLSLFAVVGVLGVGFAMRGRILEAWWVHELESDDQTVRESAVRKLGESGSRRAVLALARALADEDRWGTRWPIAARALIRIGPQVVVETFESLDSPDHELEIDTLVTILDTMGQEPDLRTDETMRQVRACLRARSDRVRVLCAQFLGHMAGEVAADSVLPALLRGIESGGPAWRAQCMYVLGEFGEAAAPHASLLAGFLMDPDQEVRDAAQSALGEIGFGAVPPVLALLETGDATGRQRALAALERIAFVLDLVVDPDEPPRGVPPHALAAIRALLDALTDPDDEVRASAAGALYSFSLESIERHAIVYDVVAALLAAARDPAPSVRASAVRALAVYRVDPARVVPFLASVADDPDARVRREAVTAVTWYARVAPEAVVRAIARALDDGDAAVRATAATEIGDLGQRAARCVEKLRTMARADVDEEVRQAAAVAVTRIAGSVTVPSEPDGSLPSESGREP